jgi:hypothetical protein
MENRSGGAPQLLHGFINFLKKNSAKLAIVKKIIMLATYAHT